MKEATVNFRGIGNWYVSQGVDLKKRGGCCLESRYGNGSDAPSAIEDHWLELTNIAPDEYLVYTYDGERHAVRWNGYRWATVVE